MSALGKALRAEDAPEEAFIIIPESAAWGCSGLSLGDFSALISALVESGHIVRSRRDLIFANLEAASLVLTGRPRRRRRP